MTASISFNTSVSCSNCRAKWTADIWMVVDVVERPDLIEQICQGAIHKANCPYCDYQADVGAPLLLFNRAPPHLIFSPAPENDLSDDDACKRLSLTLEERLGDQWSDAWLSEILVVSRGSLASELVSGISISPQDRLSLAFKKLDQESTFEGAKRVIEAHECLLSFSADKFLENLLEACSGQEEISNRISTLRSTLGACRVAGIETAIRELSAHKICPSADLYVENIKRLSDIFEEHLSNGQSDLALKSLQTIEELAADRPHFFELRGVVVTQQAKTIAALAAEGRAEQAELLYRKVASIAAAHRDEVRLSDLQGASAARVVAAFGKVERIDDALRLWIELKQLTQELPNQFAIRRELAQLTFALTSQLAEHRRFIEFAFIVTDLVRFVNQHPNEDNVSDPVLLTLAAGVITLRRNASADWWRNFIQEIVKTEIAHSLEALDVVFAMLARACQEVDREDLRTLVVDELTLAGYSHPQNTSLCQAIAVALERLGHKQDANHKESDQDDSGNSFAVHSEGVCPDCAARLRQEIWVIVDVEERADLAKLLREGTIHDLKCPACGSLCVADAPVLLFRPLATLPLVWSPPRHSNVKPTPAELIAILRGRYGAQWRPYWVTDGLPIVPREQLSDLMDDNMSVVSGRLQIDRAISEELIGLLSGDWNDFRQLAESKPHLLNELAVSQLEDAVEAISVNLPQGTVRDFRRRCGVVSRCARVGVAAAFAEQQDLDNLVIQVLNPNCPDQIQAVKMALARTDRRYDPTMWSILQETVAACLLRLKPSDADKERTKIEEAIEHLEKALEVRTREAAPELWAQSQLLLSIAYRSRNIGDQPENREMAVRCAALALEVIDPQSAQWSFANKILAQAYQHRQLGNTRENLDVAIGCCNRALEGVENSPFPEVAGEIHELLADLLDALGDTKGVILRLQQALDVDSKFQQAEAGPNRIRASPSIFEESRPANRRAHVCAKLAAALLKENAIEEVIRYSQIGLADNSGDSESLAGVFHSYLGYAHQYQQNGDPSGNLARAELHFQLASGILAKTDPGKAAELAYVLSSLYFANDSLETYDRVEQSIFEAKRALDLLDNAPNGALQAKLHRKLAECYSIRIAGDRTDNRDQAVEYAQKSLAALDPDPDREEWISSQLVLANVYARNDTAESLFSALQHYELVIAKSENCDNSNWASAKINLARACQQLSLEFGHDYWDRSLDHLRDAERILTRGRDPLQWAEIQHDIGRAFVHQAASTGSEQLREEGERRFRLALEVQTVEADPTGHLRTQQDLAGIYFKRGDWTSAHASYSAALTAWSRQKVKAYTIKGKSSDARAIDVVFLQDAYCLLKLGRISDAFARLVSAKSRLFVAGSPEIDQVLAQTTSSRREHFEAIRRTALEIQKSQYDGNPDRLHDPKLIKATRRAQAELSRAIEDLGAQTSYQQSTWTEIESSIRLLPVDSFVVAPLFLDHDGVAFVFPAGIHELGPEHVVDLPTLNADSVNSLLLRTVGSEGWAGWIADYTGREEEPGAWRSCIERTAEYLWDILVGPLVERLRTLNVPRRSTVAFIPQGALGLLPVHAAWNEFEGHRRYFLDEFSFCYLPGLKSFRERGRSPEEDAEAPNLFTVVDPAGDLSFARSEGLACQKVFGNSNCHQLAGSDATPSAVLSCIGSHQYIHFACHGAYSWFDSLYSALFLAGGRSLPVVHIQSIANLSNCRMITLSACETGINDISGAPEQFLGLPLAFIQIGAQAVLSSRWAVEDLSTMLLMERFYELHVGPDSLSPAAALGAAQCWLRDLTAGQLRNRFIAERADATSVFEKAEISRQFRRFAARPENDRPFEHPFYWAAFALTGC